MRRRFLRRRFPPQNPTDDEQVSRHRGHPHGRAGWALRSRLRGPPTLAPGPLCRAIRTITGNTDRRKTRRRATMRACSIPRSKIPSSLAGRTHNRPQPPPSARRCVPVSAGTRRRTRTPEPDSADTRGKCGRNARSRTASGSADSNVSWRSFAPARTPTTERTSAPPGTRRGKCSARQTAASGSTDRAAYSCR